MIMTKKIKLTYNVTNMPDYISVEVSSNGKKYIKASKRTRIDGADKDIEELLLWKCIRRALRDNYD